MRLSYMKPQETIFQTDKWIWSQFYEPTKWKAKLRNFLFEKLKAWGWLVRLYEERSQMVTVEIDGRSLIDLIRLQMDILVREDRRPAEVVLGCREWGELTRDNSLQSYLGFTWSPSHYDYPPLFGMKVRVVPYINGVVVLPEDK